MLRVHIRARAHKHTHVYFGNLFFCFSPLSSSPVESPWFCTGHKSFIEEDELPHQVSQDPSGLQCIWCQIPVSATWGEATTFSLYSNCLLPQCNLPIYSQKALVCCFKLIESKTCKSNSNSAFCVDCWGRDTIFYRCCCQQACDQSIWQWHLKTSSAVFLPCSKMQLSTLALNCRWISTHNLTLLAPWTYIWSYVSEQNRPFSCFSRATAEQQPETWSSLALILVLPVIAFSLLNLYKHKYPGPQCQQHCPKAGSVDGLQVGIKHFYFCY